MLIHQTDSSLCGMGMESYCVESTQLILYFLYRFHSVVQVSVHEFNSCTENADEKRIVWGLSHSDGIATVVGLESGLNHYFISDVNGDCEEGHKLMVE